jgi:Cupredoxin-like domain
MEVRRIALENLAMKLALLVLGALLAASSALADDSGIPLKLKDHRFTPAVIHVKANVPNVIVMTNEDATAEEFDSNALKVEKVVAGGSSGNVRIRPLAPGRYPFMGEYHSDTAQGVVVAE